MLDQLQKFIRETLNFESEQFAVEACSDFKFGHYSTNIALRLAGKFKKPPLELAKEFAERLKAADKGEMFFKIEVAAPGFINFWLERGFVQNFFGKIKKAGANWGKPAKSEKKTLVIDYSHPNIAKPMSVAHLRSTIIGQAIYNVFKFRGWKTIGDNHLGDWGRQFGVLIAAYKEKQTIKVKKISVNDLLELYVDYSARMKDNPELEELARIETSKLQKGDKINLALWKKFYAVSLAEFKKIYKILEVKFDYYLGESFYNPMLAGVVADALGAKVAETSEGAIIIPIQGLAPFIIQKRDGAYLYSTTDLAAIKYRIKKFKPSLILYVVDNGQSLHFEQLFFASKKLGFTSVESLVHVKFGLILGEDFKKLSTRAGRHISLEAVINESIDKARKIVDEKRGDLKTREREVISKTIGIAALKYNDLSQNRQSDISFNWDKMLNLEGNSAPYLLYTYARLISILRKAKLKKVKPVKLESSHDLELILKLIQFPDVLHKVTLDYFPHGLADYLYELAKAANNFYQSEPVLKAEAGLRVARLELVEALVATLGTGLMLLGIKPLQRM